MTNNKNPRFSIVQWWWGFTATQGQTTIRDRITPKDPRHPVWKWRREQLHSTHLAELPRKKRERKKRKKKEWLRTRMYAVLQVQWARCKTKKTKKTKKATTMQNGKPRLTCCKVRSPFSVSNCGSTVLGRLCTVNEKYWVYWLASRTPTTKWINSRTRSFEKFGVITVDTKAKITPSIAWREKRKKGLLVTVCREKTRPGHYQGKQWEWFQRQR